MFKTRSVDNAMKKRNFSRTALTLAACLLVSACSSTVQNHSEGRGPVISDPIEDINRFTFGFNHAVNNAFIHPIVKGYQFVVPEPGRKGVRNVLRNLKSPVTFANQLLQGDIGGAGDALGRAVVNTTAGIGGLFDVADHMGMKYENEDFGQTLAVWGVGHGPYIVLPFLGPSTMRDYTGYIVDAFADPLRIYLFNINEENWYYAKVGAEYLDLRESLIDVLEDLEVSSIDYYAAVRSIYHQKRDAMVRDETSSTSQAFDMPDFDDEE